MVVFGGPCFNNGVLATSAKEKFHNKETNTIDKETAPKRYT
ncbi:MAG: hypothetical protein U0T78_00965 [Cloacibacterium normanense]